MYFYFYCFRVQRYRFVMYCTILICYDFGIFVLKKVKKRAENLEMTINSVTFAKDIKQYFLKQ